MTESSRSVASAELIGRDAEVDRIDAVLDHLGEGGDALVLSGEAGIGKSALLDHARERASLAGATTLVTVGVESEAELAFAALHQLLRPVIGLIELLPEPQRRALGAAFAMSDEPEPNPFRVALAAYQLVCQAAESSPLVLIVDDAHWIDRSSLGVLTFIARRLESEPVVLLTSLRSGYSTPLEDAHLPSLRVERLSATAAAELLDRNAPDLHPILRARVLAEADGNPLALVELARVMTRSARAGESLSSTPISLTVRLEQAFAARLGDLPEETRLGLLAAALDGRASLEEIVNCAAEVHRGPVAVSALDVAVEAELVEILEAQLRFRHPLIRAAVRQAAPPALVLAMYGALAGAVADPERRLWHRAMAAIGSDEEIAAELEAHATAARRRGAVTVAAAALERSAALTADPRRKGDRLVRAAEVAYELGLVDVVRRLLGQAESLEAGPLEAARLAWLRQMISGDVWFEKGATRRFVAIACRMRDGGDPDMALRSLVPIAHRCWWTRPSDATRQHLVETAESVGVPGDDPRLLAVIALAHPEATGPAVLNRIAHRDSTR